MMINGATTLCFILVYLRCVVTLSDFTCSSYPVAHNSDIVWNWTSIDAMTSYTRISHTSHIFSKIVSSPRLIIVGGIENEFAQPVVTNCVLVYDLVSKKWLTASDIVYPLESLSYASPASRSMHSSFETNGIGYLFGGLQKANANDAWRFCFDSSASTMIWDQLKSKGFLPTPRAGHTFVQVYENSSSIGAILFGGTEDVGVSQCRLFSVNASYILVI
jgi:hypothetical protein